MRHNTSAGGIDSQMAQQGGKALGTGGGPKLALGPRPGGARPRAERGPPSSAAHQASGDQLCTTRQKSGRRQAAARQRPPRAPRARLGSWDLGVAVCRRRPEESAVQGVRRRARHRRLRRAGPARASGPGAAPRGSPDLAWGGAEVCKTDGRLRGGRGRRAARGRAAHEAGVPIIPQGRVAGEEEGAGAAPLRGLRTPAGAGAAAAGRRSGGRGACARARKPRSAHTWRVARFVQREIAHSARCARGRGAAVLFIRSARTSQRTLAQAGARGERRAGGRRQCPPRTRRAPRAPHGAGWPRGSPAAPACASLVKL